MRNRIVIIPTYNEKDNIHILLTAIFEHNPDLHILFVDDNSPDGTGYLLDTKASEDERIHVLHRTHKQGLGRAYIAGFGWALERDYERICEMDADMSHNPADLPALIGATDEADLALGSRYLDGIRVINWPLHRLMLSKGASYYVRGLTGMPFTDPTGGFKCFRREVLENLDLETITSNGYSFQIEMTHRAWRRGFKVVETPITFIEREIGVSKMSSDIVTEALFIVWQLVFRNHFRRKPANDHHPESVQREG